MAGMGPTGDYDDESFINKANKKAKPAAKKTVSVTVPEEIDDSLDEPLETEVDAEEEPAPAQGSSGGGFLGKLRNIFGVKPKSTAAPVAPELPKASEPAPTVAPKVEAPAAPEPKEEVYTADSLKWKVPEGTNRVLVNIYNSNGDKLNSYTISNFISLKSGQILEVVAD